MADPDELLARLAEDLGQTLGGELLSLAVHESFALGDFTPSRSDLDLLAVLGADPTSATFAALHEVHARLATDFPGWGRRLDVEYVSVDAIEAVVQSTAGSHQMLRIGGGEPLHDVNASRHYVLNWAAARQADRPIAGAAPSAVLPAIDQRLVQQVVVQHVRGWSQWVAEMQHPGGQAYTVLTICRAAETLATGHQVSKLAAADTGRSRFPEWSDLIEWARAWWYDGGSDQDHGRPEDVRRFVNDISERLLRQHDSPPEERPQDSADPAVLHR